MSFFPSIPPHPAATITFLDADAQTADQTVYTFSDKDLGAADSGRFVVVGLIGVDNTRTLSSCTIGGVAAAVLVDTFDGGSAAHCIYIVGALVPSGETGDIVVTFSGGVAQCQIAWARLDGANTTPADTKTSSANPLSVSLAVPIAGVGFAVARSGSSSTFSWAGLAEQSDNVAETVGFSAAAAAVPAGDAGLTVTATQSASATPKMSVVSFGPG